jgi:hypothetical protein
MGITVLPSAHTAWSAKRQLPLARACDPPTHWRSSATTRDAAQYPPDFALILPWNLREEISQQLGYVRSWGGSLVFPIPQFEVILMRCEL